MQYFYRLDERDIAIISDLRNQNALEQTALKVGQEFKAKPLTVNGQKAELQLFVNNLETYFFSNRPIGNQPGNWSFR